ncbi:MAG: hypothetical protein ABL903_13070 [Methylococcales bacterium]
MGTQKILTQDQIAAFYHDDFVKSQVEDFILLFGSSVNSTLVKIVDIGGGCGFFAKALGERMNLKVRVLDSDIQSINLCEQKGIVADYGDALKPNIIGDESIVCFNLILHHIISTSAYQTLKMQGDVLSVWQSTVSAIFINEYIYESYIFKNISGWLIYQITSNSFLSNLGRFVAKFVPSLQANTFGVGVRFRSHTEWRRIFESLGFEVVDTKKGPEEDVSLARRLLLIKSCRRDSFLLKPVKLNTKVA